MAADKPCVLFLCTHNSARSQMAEALLRHHGAGRFAACSAGAEPTEVHPLTRQVLEEVGIEAKDLRAKGLNAFLGKARVRAAIVVCEQTDPGCPRVFPFAREMLRWPFEDPAAARPAEQLATFRRVRDQIAERVQRFVRDGA